MNTKLVDSDPELLETLIILSEECSELSVECSKIMRFGLSESAKDRLTKESCDIIAMMIILMKKEVIKVDDLDHGVKAKFEKLRYWSSITL